MEIQKLKKRLLREELRRRRKSSRKHRLLVNGVLLGLILLFGGLIFFTLNLDRRLEADYHEAEALLQEGRYEEAAVAFRRVHDRHPGFRLAPQALFQAGEVLDVFLRLPQEAVLTYLLVEKDYPETEMARKAQAQVAEIYKTRLRDYGQAVVAYQKLLDAGGDDADRIQYEIADAYFRLNNFEQARIEFESLLKNFPQSPLVPEVQYRLGVTAYLEGDGRRAEEAFRLVAERWPRSPYAAEARFSLAELLEEREELGAALDLLEALQGVYPNPEALDKRIERISQRIGKKKKAI